MSIETLNEVDNCKYRLPCGWCDRKNETCKFYVTPGLDMTESNKPTEGCDHFWECCGVDTKYWHYRCKYCGEHRKELIYHTKSIDAFKPDTIWEGIPEACRYCSNHPSNGGSGICHCILGLSQVACGTTVGTSGNITVATSNGSMDTVSSNTNVPYTLTTNTEGSNWTNAHNLTAGPSISTNTYTSKDYKIKLTREEGDSNGE